MNNFIIAAAQSPSIKGNIDENILVHQKFIDRASNLSASVIVFPELSLTGYEPSIAKDFSFTGKEENLKPLKEAAVKKNIMIVAGCPIHSGFEKPYLGAFIFHPTNELFVYRKRYLHKGEDVYFTPSEDNVVIKMKDESIGIAICADIDNPVHPADAKENGASIYAAGVLITKWGIEETFSTMSFYARQHNMLVLMANHSSDTGGYKTAGSSAIWDNSGNMLASASGSEEALIIAEKNGCWSGRRVDV